MLGNQFPSPTEHDDRENSPDGSHAIAHKEDKSTEAEGEASKPDE